ncbi:MAG TPA: PAS domain S-box protein [Syntrophorhabdales bacterium]|nr:PAS domain S-box protein [Syntrophorhabdales bacterium]
MRDKLAGLTLRTTLLYAVLAAVCFVLSGRVVAAFASDVDAVVRLDIFKGLAFVAITAFLLYGLLRRQMKWLEKEVDGRTQAELLMRETQARFVTIFRSSPMGITLSRLDNGRLIDANPAALKMLGFDREELVGRTLQDADVWISNNDRDRLTEAVAGQGTVEGVELQFRTKSGEIHTMLDSAEPIRLSGGEHYLLDMMLDITERKQAEEAKEREYRDVFETSAIGTALVALDGRWLKVNKALCDTIGYTEAELLTSKTIEDITHPDDLRSDREYLRKLMEGRTQYYRVEKRLFHKDGYTIWGLLGISMLRDAQGCPLYFVSQLEDISERKSLEEKLQAALLTDELTGLLNRNGFLEASKNLLRSQGSQASTLFLLRLNGMGLFNDRFGGKRGDAFIISTARMLQKSFRERGIVARVGGVEFAVLASGEVQGLAALLERNAANLGNVGPGRLVSASVGIARRGREHKLSVEQLIAKANEAIAAKGGSEQRVPSLPRKTRRRLPVWKRSQGKDRFHGAGFRRRPAFGPPRSSLAEESPDARRLGARKGECIPFSPPSRA